MAYYIGKKIHLDPFGMTPEEMRTMVKFLFEDENVNDEQEQAL